MRKMKHSEADEQHSEVREGSADEANEDRMPPSMAGKKKPCAKCRKGKNPSCDCNKPAKPKMDSLTPLNTKEYLAACELGIQGRSRGYIRARLDAVATAGAGKKCGKSGISKDKKCTKGAGSITSKKGPSAMVQAGQTLKGIGRGALETVKWTSGYNIGKHIATGATGGKNEKGNTGQKALAVAGSGVVFGLPAALGAARRSGALGKTDLQQHAENEKKEKKWRRSVGYADSAFSSGFDVVAELEGPGR